MCCKIFTPHEWQPYLLFKKTVVELLANIKNNEMCLKTTSKLLTSMFVRIFLASFLKFYTFMLLSTSVEGYQYFKTVKTTL